MKGARRVSYRMLVSRVKSEIPELYRALALNLYNPWADQCRQTATHFILVHSAIEYFYPQIGCNDVWCGYCPEYRSYISTGCNGYSNDPCNDPCTEDKNI